MSGRVHPIEQEMLAVRTIASGAQSLGIGRFFE